MKRLILALALIAMPTLAQVGQDPSEHIQKLVTLKYADPQSIANLLRDFGVELRVDSRMKVIALSGNRNRVTTAEDAIKQLDVPAAGQKDIELTVYFVQGSDAADPNPPEVHSAIPKDLEGTVAILKTTFPFKNYYLLDTLGLRTRSGVGADASGQLRNGRLTTFRVRSASMEGDNGMIRLENLHAGLRVPVHEGEKTSYLDTGISTDMVDVKEGQKLVVGRSSVNGPDTALFLVLIAKVGQ
jgi:hypothetical protein